VAKAQCIHIHAVHGGAQETAELPCQGYSTVAMAAGGELQQSSSYHVSAENEAPAQQIAPQQLPSLPYSERRQACNSRCLAWPSWGSRSARTSVQTHYVPPAGHGLFNVSENRAWWQANTVKRFKPAGRNTYLSALNWTSIRMLGCVYADLYQSRQKRCDSQRHT
jgi:hypothetical protein